MKKTFFVILISFLILQCIPVYAGFLPYGRIFKAAKDDRSYLTQAHDTRLQLNLHKKMLLNFPENIISISSYVFLGHGFLVGEVDNIIERTKLIECTKEIPGLNGLSYFLPVKNSTITSTSSTLEIKIKGILEPDYPSSKLTVKVVQNTIVLLGVLGLNEQKKVCDSVLKISGTSQLINFIQSPTENEAKRKRFHPLRNIFE